MANDSRRVSQLNVTTTLDANDRVVVLTGVTANSLATKTMTINTFSRALANTTLPIANTSTKGIVSVDGVTIVAAANGRISATNLYPQLTIYTTPMGSNNSVTEGNYQMSATALRVNTEIQYLSANGDSGQNHFYLPPASNGTLMYFVGKTPFHNDDIVIWVDSARKMGQTNPSSPAAWVPYYYGMNDRNLAQAIYIDGAWNFDTNNFYY